MKKIKKIDPARVSQDVKKMPVCPNCGNILTKGIYELDDGEPGIYWTCGCAPTEEELEEYLDEVFEDDDDPDYREMEY